jgi:phenylacetate-CoA ligase
MEAIVPLRLALMRMNVSRQGWRDSAIREYQDRRLRTLIRYCWKHVPYYRAKWTGHIESPDDIQTIEDLQKLPVLTKDEWREHNDEFVTDVGFLRGEAARTGGSTGRPTLYRMTRMEQEMAWAQNYTGWNWAGWRPGEVFQVVGGESIGIGLGDRRVWRDKLMNRYVTSGSNLTIERTKALVASPHFHDMRLIYGYPNAIRELCDLLSVVGERPRGLRGVVCTAEVMRQEVRDDIARVLGVPVYDQWGMNDGGLLASEGPERDGLHVFFTRSLLEIVDEKNQQITAPGQTGRALATSLINFSTPFVRYETGDQVHWYSRDPAPSGIAWPRIGQVEGRTGDVIYLPSGRRIAMPGLTLVMRWIDGLKQYQFIQTAPDAVTVRLDRAPDFRMGEGEVLSYLREKISPEIRWQIVWGPPELTRNSKLLIIRNDWLRAQGLTRPAPERAVSA